MEHILDWHMTKDSVKRSYDEATNQRKFSSPIFPVDFGSVTTQWQIELIELMKEDDFGAHLCGIGGFYEFYLRLLKMDTKTDVPTELQKSNGPVTQITVQCRPLMKYNSDPKLPKPEPMDFSFHSDIDEGGISVRFEWPLRLRPRPSLPSPLEKNSNAGFHIRVNLECISSVPSMTFTSQGLAANQVSDLGEMLASGQDSDIIIKCGSDSHPVHKLILSWKSPVFRAMLNSDMVEASSGEIKIEDVQPLVMKQFLNFMYTTRVEFNNMSEEQIFDLITAADKYQVIVLKQLCFQSLINNIDEKICGKVAVAAYVHQAEVWQKNMIYPYIAKHWESLGADEEFQELVEAYPAAFLNKRTK